MAVGLSESNLAPYMDQVNGEIPGEMIIACFNSPTNNTVSGDEAKIDALKTLLDADGVFARKLNVVNAYHSAHMKAVANEYLELIGNISSTDKLSLTQEIHMVSTVTGGQVQQDQLETAQYWVDNMVTPVRFTQALSTLCFDSLRGGQASLRLNASAESTFVDEIVEIGPHSALQSAIKSIVALKTERSLIGYSHVLDRRAPGVRTILNTAGSLYCRGCPIDILAVNKAFRLNSKLTLLRMLTKVPPYSFNHSRKIFYESRLSRNFRLRKFPRHDLFGAPVSDWNENEPRWRHFIRLSENPWLRDHMVKETLSHRF